MITALRSRNIRQVLPNPNLSFFRYISDDVKKMKDSKAAATHILQNSDCRQLPTEEENLKLKDSEVTLQQVCEYPEQPVTCCMSGCANCVWLDYVEKLSAYYGDGGEHAMKEIDEKIDDPNIKAFLLQELRCMKKS